jgi:hypothetical protein
VEGAVGLQGVIVVVPRYQAVGARVAAEFGAMSAVYGAAIH